MNKGTTAVILVSHICVNTNAPSALCATDVRSGIKLFMTHICVDAGDTYPMTGLYRYRKRTDRKLFINTLNSRVII